jgi:hypothetical protein
MLNPNGLVVTPQLWSVLVYRPPTKGCDLGKGLSIADVILNGPTVESCEARSPFSQRYLGLTSSCLPYIVDFSFFYYA